MPSIYKPLLSKTNKVMVMMLAVSLIVLPARVSGAAEGEGHLDGSGEAKNEKSPGRNAGREQDERKGSNRSGKYVAVGLGIGATVAFINYFELVFTPKIAFLFSEKYLLEYNYSRLFLPVPLASYYERRHTLTFRYYPFERPAGLFFSCGGGILTNGLSDPHIDAPKLRGIDVPYALFFLLSSGYSLDLGSDFMLDFDLQYHLLFYQEVVKNSLSLIISINVLL